MFQRLLGSSPVGLLYGVRKDSQKGDNTVYEGLTN